MTQLTFAHPWVLLFLACFTVLAWWLNREYWKDIK